MKLELDIKLDFKDVLIRPKRSNLSSRKEVNLEREITFRNCDRKWKGIPLIAANMDTIGTFEMYRELSCVKIITCFHKHYTLEDFQTVKKHLDPNFYMISTGISEDDWFKLVDIIKLLDPMFVCVDVANGYMDSLLEFTLRLRKNYPNIVIACGNVVTRELVEDLSVRAGVNIIKCGIGSGGVCTTRLQTGVGMPQLSAVSECADAAHGLDSCIISDGGITVPGDIAKALGAGADFVMMGSILAGHTECAGQLMQEGGKAFKIFYGMSRDTAMKKYSGGVAPHRSSEGKTVKVAFKGPVKNTVDKILGGLRSSCTYIGASRIKDMPKCTTFVRVNSQVNNIFT